MRDAQRLARACNQAGVSDCQFTMACILLGEVGIEAALAFVQGQWERGQTLRPYQPALCGLEEEDAGGSKLHSEVG
jgi:hypothetical protein